MAEGTMFRPGGELWGLTTFFNICKSKRRLENYRRFRESLSIPLATVELALDGEFQLDSNAAEIVQQVSDADLMWQKEKLLNLGIGLLPASCRYVAVLDADIEFCETDWTNRTIEKLQSCDIIQPFGFVTHLGKSPQQTTRQQWIQPSFAAGLQRGATIASIVSTATNRDAESYAIGFAWAGHRERIEQVGFYEYCITGGGDTAWAAAMAGGEADVMELHRMNDAQRSCYRKWVQRVRDRSFRPVGVISGEIRHLWHGEMSQRRPQQRHDAISQHQFDPELDLLHSSEGCWRFGRDNPGLRNCLRDYLTQREASID